MNRTAFTYPSPGKDNVTIHALKWEGTETPRAVMQIAHGMAEHIARYEQFAQFLVSHGFVVYGNDHRGHGQTAGGKENLGYFADVDGFERVVDDMYVLTQIIRREHQDLPLFLLGHSMGSFLSRRYVQRYGSDLSGVILCGTGGDPGMLGKVGLCIAKREVRRKGAKTLSPKMDKLIFGNYNRRFRPARTAFDWLNRDKVEVDKYVADPMCGNVMSASFYVDLLSGILAIHRMENVKKTPSTLPIFLIAGADDPVGNYGKGVRQVQALYERAGVEDVTCKLYSDRRHELLNEKRKEEVYGDVVSWLAQRLV